MITSPATRMDTADTRGALRLPGLHVVAARALWKWQLAVSVLSTVISAQMVADVDELR